MQIPFYNFSELHNEEFREQALQRMADIFAKNAFIEGQYNDALEAELATMQGAKHCLLVANGTDALEIALLAHNIGHGHKVAVPDITFHASAEAVLNIGATPVFIDVHPDTGLICVDSLNKAIAEHEIDAVMPVHIYGLPAPIAEIEELCMPLNIPIIEDAAQAHGALLPNGPVGCTDNLTTFSFYPTKNLSAFGDAGAILTQSDEMAEIIKTIRNHGRGEPQLMGRNSRCDHMQAAILHLKLQKVEGYNKTRRNIARNYHQALKNLPMKLLPDSYLGTSSWHLYPVQLDSTKQCQQLHDHLQTNGIGCVASYYDTTVSQLKVFDQFPADTPKAQEFAGRVLCLPMSPFVSEQDITQVAEVIAAFFS